MIKYDKMSIDLKDEHLHNSDHQILLGQNNSGDMPQSKYTKMCIATVQQSKWVLHYVKQTSEICMIAVKYDGSALEFVKNKTYDICMAAVQQNAMALCFVPYESFNISSYYEICMEAVQQHGLALQYVHYQTYDKTNSNVSYELIYTKICMIAVKQAGLALRHVKHQTIEICMAAVQQKGLALRYVTNQTREICEAAIKSNGYACIYIVSEQFNNDEYLHLLYMAIYKSDNFFMYNVHYNEPHTRMRKLKKYIKGDTINQVLAISKRSIKRAI
jgi:hypothetical protein